MDLSLAINVELHVNNAVCTGLIHSFRTEHTINECIDKQPMIYI